jgi:hypothetical protein
MMTNGMKEERAGPVVSKGPVAVCTVQELGQEMGNFRSIMGKQSTMEK